MFTRLALRAARLGFTRAAAFSTAPSVFRTTVALASTGVAAASVMVAFADATPHGGIPGTDKERTFIAVKPDGVERAIVGDIISKFEKKGYTLVGLKLVHPTEEQAAQHYDDLKDKPFYPKLIKYFSSGPIVGMVWQGKDVVKQGRVLLGATNPRVSAPGTIRGDFAIDVGRNVCHGSDATDSAIKEITFWFKEGELADWERPDHKWIYE
jgi:nucleoside-diphosphate kinase